MKLYNNFLEKKKVDLIPEVSKLIRERIKNAFKKDWQEVSDSNLEEAVKKQKLSELTENLKKYSNTIDIYLKHNIQDLLNLKLDPNHG